MTSALPGIPDDPLDLRIVRHDSAGERVRLRMPVETVWQQQLDYKVLSTNAPTEVSNSSSRDASA
jgi:hypothetical protein